MKRLIFLFVLMSSLAVTAKPKVFFNYKVFYTPDHSPYLTTYLQFSAGTFKFQSLENGNLRTSVEITQLFKQNDTIILADKYVLDSPEMRDSVVEDFFDVQNYGLEPGVYQYELVIKDLVSGEEVKGAQNLKIEEMDGSQIRFSDIQLIQSASKSTEKNNFVKNGMFLLPYMTNYFPPEMNKIAFYAEIYNSSDVLGDSSQFIMTYTIKDFTTQNQLEGIFKFQRFQSSKVIPVIGLLPIERVPTGDFALNLNIINKDNDTVATEELFFQRRSDIDVNFVNLEDVQIDDEWIEGIDWDSIPYFLGSIMPIAPRYEYETIRKMFKEKDTTRMQKYLYSFWKKTAPENTAEEWYSYRHTVYYCEKMFGTQIKSAWETDRGRIWLKYGAPNQFIDRPNEPSAYPYQIWHYYRIGQRSDIRFVFYNPDLVTNDYPLLHSDMQGELQNYRWQNDLHKRDAANYNLDNPGGSVHYGGNANVYYNEIDR